MYLDRQRPANPAAVARHTHTAPPSLRPRVPRRPPRLLGHAGVEAAGFGVDTDKHAATLTKGTPGVLHGSMSYLIQDDDGQIVDPHSISAGLDYPGVGPEHAFLKEMERAEYIAVTDDAVCPPPNPPPTPPSNPPFPALSGHSPFRFARSVLALALDSVPFRPLAPSPASALWLTVMLITQGLPPTIGGPHACAAVTGSAAVVTHPAALPLSCPQCPRWTPHMPCPGDHTQRGPSSGSRGREACCGVCSNHMMSRRRHAWGLHLQALEAFQEVSQLEGIIPALETSHALAHLKQLAPTLPDGTRVVLNFSGRGDKDVNSVMKYLKLDG